jgi:octaprenyl-diphosphate synthase
VSESLHNPVPPRPGAAPGALPDQAALLGLVGAKLAAVEEELQRNLSSDFGVIDATGRYVAESGGKRIRPILVLLTSGLLGYRGDVDVLMGAVFEFIHTATLVHDDIIDEAETRRGRPSANHIYGNETSVLFGDYLYIRSMNMALRAGELRLIDILADATERMIEGEILGANLRGRTDASREQHMEIVERKTARLFSACCRVSGVIARVPREREEALARYGLSLGIAFQLVDDLLDLTSDEKTVGKPVASDLREGRMTLPWIDLYERGSDDDRRAIRRIVSGGAFNRVEFERLRRALDEHGCLDRSRGLAVEHARRARDIMLSFPSGPYRQWLLRFPEMVLDRDR